MKKRITDPQYRVGFMLVTTLFFMWGLSYGLLDVLNKHFQETFEVTRARSALLQAAYFGAYFIAALPAGLFMSKKGYKAGIIMGLSFYAIGCILFVPATFANSFYAFLLALFVVALGLGFLETAANPYSSALGDTETAETRLNLSQSFNGLGQFFGPLIGGAFFFEVAGTASKTGSSAVVYTYLVIAVIVLLLIALFARTPLPDLRERETQADQLAGSQGHRLWDHKEFIFGVVTLFFYVAAQVGVGAFFINLSVETWQGISNSNASYFLSLAMLAFMLGRFASTAVMTKVSAPVLMGIYAVINVLLCALILLGLPQISTYATIAIFFFMSIMFPTIFALGVKNLGSKTKIGSSFMIMAIVGGAIMPYFMGLLADHVHTAISYSLPLVCFVIAAVYSFTYKNKIIQA